MKVPFRSILSVLAMFLITADAWGQSWADVEATILRQSNAFRASQGVALLRAEPTLMSVAQKHARNLARQDKYGDDNKSGHVLNRKGPMNRIREAKYAYVMFGENVAWNKGFADPGGTAMHGWKSSPGHRKNLLGKEFTETGVGVARGNSGRWYLVQVFARPLSQMTRVRVQIENHTHLTIRFRIEGYQYSLPPGGTGIYSFSKPFGPVEYLITWPDAGGEVAGTFQDSRGRYAFVQEGGRFHFRKVGVLRD